MMTFGKTIGAALIMGVLLAALSGCQKKEGPAERAGKVVDQTVEKVGQQVEKAGESIQDAAKGDSKK
jgi:hypothetical protein